MKCASAVITLVLALAVTPGLAWPSDEWTAADTRREIMWQVLHLADWSQTLQIAERSDLREANPLLGDSPSKGRVNTYFALTAVSHWRLSRRLSPKWRRRWQWASIGLAGAVVLHNKRQGLSIRLTF